MIWLMAEKFLFKAFLSWERRVNILQFLVGNVQPAPQRKKKNKIFKLVIIVYFDGC